MRLITTIVVFGFMLIAIAVAPVTTSDRLSVGFGVNKTMASGLVCDCTTAAAADTSASKTKDDADKAKDDYDKDKTEENKTALDDADKAKDDADKAKDDADAAVAAAPCSCGDGATGYWTDTTGGNPTPPGGDAPKTERQLQGQ